MSNINQACLAHNNLEVMIISRYIGGGNIKVYVSGRYVLHCGSGPNLNYIS